MTHEVKQMIQPSAASDQNGSARSCLSTDRRLPADGSSQMVVPQHVAVIMDGNGRWARRRGLPRLEGHRAGATAVQRAIELSIEFGVRYLTLFSFSSENWHRSAAEVQGLMELFNDVLLNNLDYLLENQVRLRLIGETSRLPDHVLQAFSHDESSTKDCDRLTLVLAVSYGGREEIAAAARILAKRAAEGELNPDEISPNHITNSLWTAGIPDPELLIRTSGEMRVSNFLLWQIAYSEIVVCPELWPEFDRAVFSRSLAEYSRRERRFGLTSEQVRSTSTPAKVAAQNGSTGEQPPGGNAAVDQSLESC